MRAQVIAADPGGRGLGARGRGRGSGHSRGGGRVLLAVGAVVAAAAVTAYFAAIATHPVAAMLKGFDLQVYLGGARQALRGPGDLYAWTYDGHQGIQFTYPPFSALLFTAGLTIPFPVLMRLATAASVLALFVTVAIAFRELGWRGAPRLGATLMVAGLALWTESVQRALFLGQVELVLMAVVTWDLCQPDGRRLKGAGTGLAAGIKLVPLLFIVYLLLTRRFRQAAVAAGAFAATVVLGFAAFPAASVTWWLDGDFAEAGRTGFVGGQQNQSLRGALTRLAGSVDGAQAAWLVVAVAVALAGLAAAVLLDRRGLPFAGLMTCALTALLVSPVSWDHHWVWLAPGLALLIDAGHRAARQPRPNPAERPPPKARFAGAQPLETRRPFEGWPAEMRSLEVRPPEVQSLEVQSLEVQSLETRFRETRLPGARLPDVRPLEARFAGVRVRKAQSPQAQLSAQSPQAEPPASQPHEAQPHEAQSPQPEIPASQAPAATIPATQILAAEPSTGRQAAVGAAWYAVAAATWVLFAAWPGFWSAKAGLLQGGLIGYAPASAWAHGDNPAYAEYHWHGLRLLAGNLELLVGLALYTVALTAAFLSRRPARAALAEPGAHGT